MLKAILIIFISTATFASEVDSYTGTDKFVWSAVNIVNEDINSRLKKAVLELNNEEIACPMDIAEEEDVYDVIKSSLAAPAIGQWQFTNAFVGYFIDKYFEELIPKEKQITVPMEKSIYDDITWGEGFSLKWKHTTGIIKVNGFLWWGTNLIGLDKIGHFFVEGWSFFERAYLNKNASIDSAIEWGRGTENGKFGKVTTGVFSHADLVANFNGMRFWNQIMMLRDDPISDGRWHKRPYLKCRNAMWRLEKEFDLEEYTDGAWDERNNCNAYKSKEVRAKVYLKILSALDDDDIIENDGVVCPLIRSRCDDAVEKYASYSKKLLYPACHDKTIKGLTLTQ